jgi:hypothetical protein
VIIRAIYGFYGKEKVKNRVANPTKNNPYLSQKLRKREAVVQVLSSKKLSCIYSVFEYSLRTLGEALLEKIYRETHRIPWRNETQSDLLLNSHGREYILCTNQIGLSNSAESILYRQVRHS